MSLFCYIQCNKLFIDHFCIIRECGVYLCDCKVKHDDIIFPIALKYYIAIPMMSFIIIYPVAIIIINNT